MLNVAHLLYRMSNLSLDFYWQQIYVYLFEHAGYIQSRNVNLSLKVSENGFLFLSLSITYNMGNLIFRQFYISRTNSKNLVVLGISLKTGWIGWYFSHFLFSFDITIKPVFLSHTHMFCHLSKFIGMNIYPAFFRRENKYWYLFFST